MGGGQEIFRGLDYRLLGILVQTLGAGNVFQECRNEIERPIQSSQTPKSEFGGALAGQFIRKRGGEIAE